MSFLYSALLLALLVMIAPPLCAADEAWPPAPKLPAAAPAQDSAPLPPSVTADPLEKGRWRCTFRFRPDGQAERVALAGSFNTWNRAANAMQLGPDGDWTTQIELDSGVYQYKFLVNGEQWFADPRNTDRVPDSFGGHNSSLRLGRLAQLKASTAQVGDGQIDALGLAHQPTLPLYVQALGPTEVSLRYRTLAHDVQQVALAVKGQGLRDMTRVCEGPLFAYWEARLTAPAEDKAGGKARGVEYTFVLTDGSAKSADPYTYYYTFAPTAAVRTPDWAKRAVWYEIVLDRFRNGNTNNDPTPVRPWTSEWFTPSEWEGKDGQTFYANFAFARFYGGDLDGLESQLPYLKELGVNALYLTPVFKAPSYHKYDVQNYLHVDDGFGTRGDYDKVAAAEDLLNPKTWQWTETDKRFIAFLQKAHEQGFKVILDAVFNHAGVDHPAFKDVVQNGKKSRFADWFDVLAWDPFQYRGWAEFAHMPVYKKDRDGFASKTLKEHLFAVTKRWMDPDGDGKPGDGVDGWRLDVPNDIPQVFWAEWRKVVKQINPDALITGEVWHRADQWLDGAHFDAVMNYEFAKTVVQWLFDQKTKISASAAAARFAELQLAYPAAATYVLQNLVDSHDTDRLASMAQNPDREYDRQNRVQDNNPQYSNDKPSPQSYQRARLAALLQATYVGAPLIYYGDEAGMWGADDPTCRKPMLWKDLQPYESPEENAVLDEQLAFYKQVLALRAAHPALQEGTFNTVLADDAADVWVFVRSAVAEHILVVLNASAAPHDVVIPLGTGLPQQWKVVLGEGGDLAVGNGQVTVKVPALGGVVLQGAAQ